MVLLESLAPRNPTVLPKLPLRPSMDDGLGWGLGNAAIFSSILILVRERNSQVEQGISNGQRFDFPFSERSEPKTGHIEPHSF